ncbi:hypothetical protein [Mycobacterium sp. URHB0021]
MGVSARRASWATREAIDLTELTAETVISLPTTSSGRQALDAATIRTQYSPRRH